MYPSAFSPFLLLTSLVLPPISTENLTPEDVDSLTKSTRESMLKNLLEMSDAEEADGSASLPNGKSTAVEL